MRTKDILLAWRQGICTRTIPRKSPLALSLQLRIMKGCTVKISIAGFIFLTLGFEGPEVVHKLVNRTKNSKP